ncbi:MAG: hypothetical protein ACP5OO_00300 [Chloroflexia bacterium]
MHTRLWFLVLFVLFLAGCTSYFASPPASQALPTEASPPTAEASPTPTEVSYPTREAYPPPQGWTPEPTATSEPTPTPTTLPVPILQVQPLAAEWGKGERIAFLKDGDLWLVRPDGSAQAQVTTSGNATALYGWSYDCTRLLLGVGERPVPPETDVPGGRDLWVVWVNGHKAEPLVQGLEVLEARWSPVDEQVAYGTRDGNIHLVNGDGSEHRTLLDSHTGFFGAWSPDARQIAFLEMDSHTWGQSLALVDISSGIKRVLTNSGSKGWGDGYPIWSPEGEKILFQSTREDPHGRVRWWVMDLRGDALHLLDSIELQKMPTSAQRPSLSPVSDQVLFYLFNGDGPTIWVMDFDGSHPRKLAEGGNPTWSPDGRRIAYTDPQGALRVIHLDGTGALQIVEADQNPLWYEPYWCR